MHRKSANHIVLAKAGRVTRVQSIARGCATRPKIAGSSCASLPARAARFQQGRKGGKAISVLTSGVVRHRFDLGKTRETWDEMKVIEYALKMECY